tara:strand:- start:971 stop:1354 length:384 start_codon:yes stop_codon:yes gene_type:complete
MALRQTGKKTYRTMQGKPIDMDLLRQRNELTPAVGNARVNARGDEIGPGGKIVRKREDVLRDYYADNPQAAPDEVAKVPEVQEEVVTKAQKKVAQSKVTKKAAQAEAQDAQDEWVEDEDGNFVRRGE